MRTERIGTGGDGLGELGVGGDSLFARGRLENGECLGALRKRYVVVVAGERDVVHRLQESGLAAKRLVDGLLRDRRLVGHDPDGGTGEPTIQERPCGRRR